MDLRHVSSKSSIRVTAALFLSLVVMASLAVPRAHGRPEQVPPAALTAAGGTLLHGQPAYDSGWVDLPPDGWIELEHNLGGDTDDYVVDLQFWDRNAGSDGLGVNAWRYGTDMINEGSGASWLALTSTSIGVSAAPGDELVEAVRVRIWVVRQADYDSGWRGIDPGEDKQFWHILGGDPEDYVLDLQFRNTSGSAAGVNQEHYGGQRLNGSYFEGGFWHNLTASSVQVHRYIGDTDINEVRIRIWRRPNPAFDSGWLQITDEIYAPHYLGGPWNDTVVDLQFKDSGDGYGVNQFGYGGDTVYANPTEYHGACWTNLNGTGIKVHRGADDLAADRVRVRLWTSSAPKYDSGWFDLDQPDFRTLNHNLSGIPDAYKVELQFRDTAADGVSGLGVNQSYPGGDYRWDPAAADFVSQGVWWRSLTSDSLFVYRHQDDTGADQARVRLWIPPDPDYDSGWTAIDGTLLLNHGLHIAAHYMVIDLQFLDDVGESPNGINNRAYGGDTFFGGGFSLRAHGAYWHDLTFNTISVTRLQDADLADKVRVRIWVNTSADYDSNWQNLESVLPLNHDLGADPGDMVVDLLFQDLASSRAHHRSYGGNDLYGYGKLREYGARWQNLTNTAIEVKRQPDDAFADRARVRIWQATQAAPNQVFLPLIIRR